MHNYRKRTLSRYFFTFSVFLFFWKAIDKKGYKSPQNDIRSGHREKYFIGGRKF